MEPPTDEILDEPILPEELEAPLQRVRRAPEEVVPLVRDCVRNFPLSAVLTAFAGGLLVGLAMHRRSGMNVDFDAFRKPMNRGRQAFTAALESALDSIREGTASARSAIDDVDLRPMQKQMKRWWQKLPL